MRWVDPRASVDIILALLAVGIVPAALGRLEV